MNRRRLPLLYALCILHLLVFPALAKDIGGGGDHPLISRYASSEIVRQNVEKFDEYRVLTGKVTRGGGKAAAKESLKTEGKVTRITYQAPAERSTLEVFRNYEDALKQAGFEVLFSCSNEGCGGRNFNHTVVSYSNEFAENYKDQRYLAAKLRREEGDVYVSLYIARNTSSGGATRNLVYIQQDVIETKPMESGLVTVDAAAMKKGIAETGHVAIYGIYFDTGKAEVKPESKPTLEEIAKLLKADPKLALLVVGHTDNQGGLDYNMDLSKRRAASVVRFLSQNHGIESSRLTSAGIAYLAPIANNKNEDGRAKNRRVELVER